MTTLSFLFDLLIIKHSSFLQACGGLVSYQSHGAVMLEKSECWFKNFPGWIRCIWKLHVKSISHPYRSMSSRLSKRPYPILKRNLLLLHELFPIKKSVCYIYICSMTCSKTAQNMLYQELPVVFILLSTLFLFLLKYFLLRWFTKNKCWN